MRFRDSGGSSRMVDSVRKSGGFRVGGSVPGVDYLVEGSVVRAFFVRGVSSGGYASVESVVVDSARVESGSLEVEVRSMADVLDGVFFSLPDVEAVEEFVEKVDDGKPLYKWYFGVWSFEFRIAEQYGSSIRILNPSGRRLKYKLVLPDSDVGSAYVFKSCGNVTYASIGVFSLYRVESELVLKLYVSRKDGDVLLHKVSFRHTTLTPVSVGDFKKFRPGLQKCYDCWLAGVDAGEECDWLSLACEFASGFWEAGGVAGVGFVLYSLPYPAVRAVGVVLVFVGMWPYFETLYTVLNEYFMVLIEEAFSTAVLYSSAGLEDYSCRVLAHLANVFIADAFGGLVGIGEDFEIILGFKSVDCRRYARAWGHICGVVTVIAGFSFQAYRTGMGLARAVKEGLKKFGWGLATPAIFDLFSIGYGGVNSLKSRCLLRLFYSSEDSFLDRVVKLVEEDGVEAAKARLEGLAKWVSVIFAKYSDDSGKARDLASIADDVSKYSDDLANTLGKSVDDLESSKICADILRKTEGLDNSVKVRASISRVKELIEERTGERAESYLEKFEKALSEMLDGWNRYYLGLLEDAAKQMENRDKVYVPLVEMGDTATIYVPRSWASDYVVVRVPWLGEEVKQMSSNHVYIEKAIVDALREKYGENVRVAVLVCPEVYNAGFIGVVHKDYNLRVFMDREYLKYLTSDIPYEDIEYLRDRFGLDKYIVFEFSQILKGETIRTRFIAKLNKDGRIYVGTLKDYGFVIDEGVFLNVKVVDVFDKVYVLENFGGKVFGGDGFRFRFTGYSDVFGGYEVEVLDSHGVGKVFVFTGVEAVVKKRSGAIVYSFGDGEKLEIHIDPETMRVEMFYTRSYGGHFRRGKPVSIEYFQDSEYNINVLLLKYVSYYGTERIQPVKIVEEGGFLKLEPMDPLTNHKLLYRLQELKTNPIPFEGELNYKKDIYEIFLKEESLWTKINEAEKYSRSLWRLHMGEKFGMDHVFTYKVNIGIGDSLHGKKPDQLIFVVRDGEKYLFFGELKSVYVSEDFAGQHRAVLDSLAKLGAWLEEEGYIEWVGEEGVYRVTEVGAEAIYDWMYESWKVDDSLPVWSVEMLKGCVVGFYGEVADVRFVLYNPNNDVIYETVLGVP